jgi:uncharacterized protein YcsI (UPF0317 family)
VHIGDPSVIGIADLSRPDYGEAVSLREGELPVFWACGVTPQNVILESRSGRLTMTSRREHLGLICFRCNAGWRSRTPKSTLTFSLTQTTVSDFMCRPDIAITHAPGCMFVTDIANESLSLS